MLGRYLLILLFIDEEFLLDIEPQSYIDLEIRKFGAILNGKYFLCEIMRSNRKITISQYSNKMHTAAFQILTFTLPMDLSFEHTNALLRKS